MSGPRNPEVLLPPRPPGSWGEAYDRVLPLLENLAGFVADAVLPLERRFLAHGMAGLEDELEAARGAARDSGLWGPQLPEELGGRALPFLEHAYVSELLGAYPLGHYVVNTQAPDAGNLEILGELGTPTQRRRFYEPLARGEIRSCFAMTEPEHAGSNPVWMSTRAVLDGGEWVLDGHKWFASSADGAAFAVVMAVTDPEAPPHARASMILVPTDTPGYRLVRNIPVMGEAGSGWASHGEIRLTGCRVPRENLLGERGHGFRIAQARLGPGRIHHCMRWLGICRRALDLMCRHAVSRQFAPGKPLAEKGVVRGWIADSRTELDAARLLVLNAAHEIDRRGQKAARVSISEVKLYVARVLQDVLDRAIQVHGGLGVTDDTPLAWFYRHERAARIYDGPDEVHREAIARRVLKDYLPEGAR